MSDDSTTGSTGLVSADSMTCREKKIARLQLIEKMISKRKKEEGILDFFFMTTLHAEVRPWKIVPSRWSIVENRLYAQNPYDKRDWRQIDICDLINIEDKRDLFYKHSIRKRKKREKLLHLITAVAD